MFGMTVIVETCLVSAIPSREGSIYMLSCRIYMFENDMAKSHIEYAMPDNITYRACVNYSRIGFLPPIAAASSSGIENCITALLDVLSPFVRRLA